MSWKAVAPGGGRHLAGKDFEGNLYFEKPDPNGNDLLAIPPRLMQSTHLLHMFLHDRRRLRRRYYILYKDWSLFGVIC